MILAIAGPPCSGKSTLAAEIARRQSIPHLSMDLTRQRILPGAAHTREERAVTYRAMAMAAELLSGVGSSVVLDAPYGHAEDRAEMTRLRAVWVVCRVSPKTAVERFRLRGPDPQQPDLNEDRVRRTAEEYQYPAGALELDTDALSREECALKVSRLFAEGDPLARP